MKAIIYAGIGLFSVATVYGLADYYSSQKNGDLKKLYAEEGLLTPVQAEEKSLVAIPLKTVLPEMVATRVESVKAKATKKQKINKRKIKMEDFSRGRIEEPVVMEAKIKEAPVVKEEVKVPEKVTVVDAEKPVVKEEIAEKKISLDMYSRAPLKKMKTVKKQQ